MSVGPGLALSRPTQFRALLSEGARSRLANVVVVAAALLPILFILPLIHQPISRDEGTYLVVAKGLLNGQMPYRDLFDHKPPLVYAWYAGSIAIFGDRPAAPRLAGALCVVATVLLIAVCAGRLYGPRGRWIAALAMASMTSISALQWGFNTETFMLPLMAGSLLAFLRAKDDCGGRWALVSGLAGGLAVLTKSVAVLNLGVLLLFPIVSRSFVADWRRGVRYSMTVLVGAVIAGTLVCLPFVAAGAGRELFYANVTYNRLYGAQIGLAERLSLSWRSALVFTIFAGPFAFLGVVGTISGLVRRSTEDWLVLTWTAASALGVVATGHFFLHYYQQLIPGMALLIGSLHLTRPPLRSPTARALFCVLAFVACCQFTQINLVPTFFGSVEARLKLTEMDEVTAQRTAEGPLVGDYLAEHMDKNDRLYNFGRETEIYFYAHARAAGPDIYDRRYWLDPSEFRPTMQALRESPPAYIVDSSTYGDIDFERPPELIELLQDSYSYETTIGFAVIYRLREPQ